MAKQGKAIKVKEWDDLLQPTEHNNGKIRSRNRTALRVLETAQPCGATINTYYKHGPNVVIDNPDLQHGFAQIPRVVLCDPTLGSDMVRVYALFLAYAWQDESTFVSQRTLAKNMGCSEDTIGRLIKKLVKRKLIRVERRGQGQPNVYHICKFSDGYLPQFVDKGSNG